MTDTRRTFCQLLAAHKYIDVPMIQRDYAQGRDQHSIKDIRNEFLAALHHALELPPESDDLPLDLDFVYGSVDNCDESPNFRPLDGQQRLTTLFLLHWYLAWLDGCIEEFMKMCVDDNGKPRFSYSVRPSSNDFFKQFVSFHPSQSPKGKNSKWVSTLIEDQAWYFRRWCLDPTIQSVLVMLDAIHEKFSSSEGMYARLIDDKQPAITFQLLDLEGFGLSDDLYIKMNARGKPLTSFEVFKARFEELLITDFSDEFRTVDGQTISISHYFSRQDRYGLDRLLLDIS